MLFVTTAISCCNLTKCYIHISNAIYIDHKSDERYNFTSESKGTFSITDMKEISPITPTNISLAEELSIEKSVMRTIPMTPMIPTIRRDRMNHCTYASSSV